MSDLRWKPCGTAQVLLECSFAPGDPNLDGLNRLERNISTNIKHETIGAGRLEIFAAGVLGVWAVHELDQQNKLKS